MLLNAANVYSIHGKLPELTNLFSCKVIHKLFEESGYENKDYRKSLWQTMGLFVASFVFAALSGNASLAHVQFEYQNLCALANVKPASPRTVERSMTQAESIAVAMKALAVTVKYPKDANRTAFLYHLYMFYDMWRYICRYRIQLLCTR